MKLMSRMGVGMEDNLKIRMYQSMTLKRKAGRLSTKSLQTSKLQRKSASM